MCQQNNAVINKFWKVSIDKKFILKKNLFTNPYFKCWVGRAQANFLFLEVALWTYLNKEFMCRNIFPFTNTGISALNGYFWVFSHCRKFVNLEKVRISHFAVIVFDYLQD